MDMRTVLYDLHKSLGGRMTDFHGWELPVQFEGIVNEHLHVRSNVGIFDVSHMGEIIVKGPQALEFLQYALTADVKDSYAGQKAVYAILCNEEGKIVDDLIVYGIGPSEFLLVVNASNTEKDFEKLCSVKEGFDVIVENKSSEYAQIAVQGPKSQQVLQPLCDFDLSQLKFFRFKTDVKVKNVPCLISRTGYTGEDGFEIYCRPSDAASLWTSLLENPLVKPIGLGARDTLRFEACLPLYGQELDETVTPFEANLSRFVHMEKGDFLGKKAFGEAKRMLIGLKMDGKAIPRTGYPVYYNRQEVGKVTSGGFCPSLNGVYAMCIVDKKEYSEECFEVMIRNKPAGAKKVSMPFYTKKYKK
jgi:glycine cleavage system T protein